MADRTEQRLCHLCGGIVDVGVTDHYDSSGAIVGTTEDTKKCRGGCTGPGV